MNDIWVCIYIIQTHTCAGGGESSRNHSGNECIKIEATYSTDLDVSELVNVSINILKTINLL